MKATGIVRRIDELGRVVIPKEIRRTLKIREGDALEIYTDRDGGVILKKYSLVGELGGFVKEYAETIHQSVGHIVAICDKDAIVASSGSSRRDYAQGSSLAAGRQISEEMLGLIDARRNVLNNGSHGDRMTEITRGDESIGAYTLQFIHPIISAGDAIGAVMLISKDKNAVFDPADIKVAETAAIFIGKQLEN
ncbi:MAG: AbrB/MazE/SpoVT family DNA-binding domain-containing protein [Clostridia bacterium]|nr:AbrB/MazE/SpoVT family DNA-binding domain-containing protein [Clostridia bacterium]